MTYRDALKHFNHNIKPFITASDKPALKQAWCFYIDTLHRQKVINDKQASLWDNPFYN